MYFELYKNLFVLVRLHAVPNTFISNISNKTECCPYISLVGAVKKLLRVKKLNLLMICSEMELQLSRQTQLYKRKKYCNKVKFVLDIS